jgi:hypothetical protein
MAASQDVKFTKSYHRPDMISNAKEVDEVSSEEQKRLVSGVTLPNES